MSKCGNHNCKKSQNKLGKSGLCKGCNIAKTNGDNQADQQVNNIDTSLSIMASKDTDTTTRRDSEIIDILKDQIEFFKKELAQKNIIIERLLEKIPSINNHEYTSSRNTIANSDTTNGDSLYTRSVTSCSNKSDNSDRVSSYRESDIANTNTIDDNNDSSCHVVPPCLPTSDYLSWQPVGQSPIEQRVTISDDYSDFNKTWENAQVRRAIIENNQVNQGTDITHSYFQEQELNRKNNPPIVHEKRTIPGNSTYADISNKGRKVGIISDSICGRLLMRDLSSKIKNGHAYRRYHPGATPKQLLDYCVNTLTNDKPDEIIIHVGTNSLRTDDPCTIANDIISIVNTCRYYGVNTIYVSAITFRPGLETEVKQVNDILYHKSHIHSFKFIGHSNIGSSLMFKDRIHLNDEGSNVLKNNFIRAVNSQRT